MRHVARGIHVAMDNENKSESAPVDTPEDENDRGQATPPRGNPETDREDVDRGEEKLDRIVGN